MSICNIQENASEYMRRKFVVTGLTTLSVAAVMRSGRRLIMEQYLHVLAGEIFLIEFHCDILMDVSKVGIKIEKMRFVSNS